MNLQVPAREAITPFEQIAAAWQGVGARFMDSAPVRRLKTRDITPDHYASFLRETYFYTRDTVQSQVSVTGYLRPKDRELIKPLVQHALSEFGHDLLALNDLAALGYATEGIPNERPLPSTLALTAYAYYRTQFVSPYSYLGRLFFLEFLGENQGNQFGQWLLEVGVPGNALAFLKEHAEADIHHNKLNRLYANKMLTSQSDIDEAVYSMGVTGKLYENMLSEAFEVVDVGTCSLGKRRLSETHAG